MTPAEQLADIRAAIDESDRLAQAATPGSVAREFHEAYERLAPIYGYQTREASAVPWSEVPKPNRDLMVATVMHVCESPARTLAVNAALRTVLDGIERAIKRHRRTESGPMRDCCVNCRQYLSPCTDAREALVSLAALHAALPAPTKEQQ